MCNIQQSVSAKFDDEIVWNQQKTKNKLQIKLSTLPGNFVDYSVGRGQHYRWAVLLQCVSSRYLNAAGSVARRFNKRVFLFVEFCACSFSSDTTSTNRYRVRWAVVVSRETQRRRRVTDHCRIATEYEERYELFDYSNRTKHAKPSGSNIQPRKTIFVPDYSL